MCLICESGSKIRRTVFGRTCYKVLAKTTDGKLRAMFHTEFEYEENSLYKTDWLKITNNRVHQGFHSYIDKKHAFFEYHRMTENLEVMKFCCSGYEMICGFVVVECRIPYFSRFIVGKDENDGVKAIVSDRIKIVRVIS